jgi:hypothetical protein
LTKKTRKKTDLKILCNDELELRIKLKEKKNFNQGAKDINLKSKEGLKMK